MDPCDRLRIARKNAGYQNYREAAEAFGWVTNTYKSHENGVRGLKLPMARKYGKAFKVSPAWLLTGEENKSAYNTSIVNIPVYHDAAGGNWLEDEGEVMSKSPNIPAISSEEYSSLHQYARKIVGNSVSNRIRHGEYAIMVRFENYPGFIPNGALVDVKRTRADGLVENSVKVFKNNALYTDSSELREQESLNMSDGNDGTTVTITGVVIAAYRSFI